MASEKINREEQKYFLNASDHKKLIKKISGYLEPDEYYQEKIYNIYFDTNYSDLIAKSLDKPIYKEKVRLRSYGVPQNDALVFFEIKRKFKSIVNKRRMPLKYSDALKYIDDGIMPDACNQIMKEIDYTYRLYNLKPKLSLNYNRDSYIAKNDSSFRLTFDYQLEYSTDIKKLTDLHGTDFLNGYYIMEIKTLKGMPLWLNEALNELKIYPKSYSKYGEIYKKLKESGLYV
jgi:SPX domain protein involved in polyphosphate accumulation